MTLTKELCNSHVPLKKLSKGIPFALTLDLEWGQKLLDGPEGIKVLQFHGEVTLTLVSYPTLRDIVLMDTILQAEYETRCIRCLDNFNKNMQLTLKSVFIEDYFAEQEEYQDLDVINCSGSNRDLYFFGKQGVDLQSFFNEIWPLHIEEYPLHHEDCKGICQFCGKNQNSSACGC